MNFIEEQGDLFQLDFNKYVFAHCIATDLKWGSGIAPLLIRDKFNAERFVRFKSELNPQGVDHRILLGSVSLVEIENVGRFYNIFTKRSSWGKPTYSDFTKAILALKNSCLENKVKYLAIPKIGCGLDKLDWSVVREIIKGVFCNTDIEIKVRYI